MNVANVESELLLISDFYKDKISFIKYNSLIDPYLFFSEQKTRTLYRLISLYYESYEEFKDVDFRIFLKTDKEYTSSYLKAGGIEAIEELITLESDSLKQNFEVVRKYALLREYDTKGFNVEKIMKHESFSKLTAKKIHDLIRTMCDSIKTKVDGCIDDNIIITENAREFVLEMIKSPDVGISFGSQGLDDVYRGFRNGQFVVEGLLSNEGKTRRMVALAVHLAFVEGEKCFIMSNEMSEKDIKSAVLISIMNHPKFWKMAESKKLSVKENDMKLGLYKDGNGDYIYRNDGEEDDEFVERIKRDSEQFRRMYKMLLWIESQINITYKYLRNYSDSDLEVEMRKEVYGNNCNKILYDTMKCYNGEDWAVLKQTATRLSELAKTLDIGVYANVQLGDISHETDIFELDSRNTGGSKGLFHVLDSYNMAKRLNKEDYSNYINIKNDGTKIPLDEKYVYYGFKVVKARSAGSHIGKGCVILYKVDLNRNIWQDVGILEKSNM